MTGSVGQRARVAWWGWLATVATSLSFVPALADRRFLLVGAFLAAVMFVLGGSLRALRLSPLAVAALQLAVLAELLLLGFGTHLRLGVLPTGRTFSSVEAVLRAGAKTAQLYAAPAPSSAGLLLMVVFVVAVVAILVDLLSLGYLRVPLAGLPLLALYTIPVAALPTGVPYWAFVPGAAAFIAMMTTDERDRLAHWGRLVSTDRSTADAQRLDTSAITATGRRVSVLAVTTAVILPLFIPAFTSSLLDGGRSVGLGAGNGGTLSFDDPMVTLANNLRRQESVDLLTVESPSVVPEYLRLVVLDSPGPDAWRSGGVSQQKIALDAGLPRPTGQGQDVAGAAHSMTITPTAGFPATSAWLPVPFNLESTDAGDGFGYLPEDQTVASLGNDSLSGVSSYGANYASVEPSRAQLTSAPAPPQAIRDRFGGVPDGVPQEVTDVAQSVTANADNPYERAVLLQNFFRDADEFNYDLDVEYGYGYQATVAFLKERQGFCQHFAATMALMARSVGIPSRVVVGFLQPGRSKDHTYVITSNEVHAWPELYFEGVGWVRFEPTPSVGAGYPAYAPPARSNSTGIPQQGRDPEATQTEARPQTALQTRTETPAAKGGSGSGPGGALPPTGVLAAVVLVGLALLPATLRRGVRRARLRRPLDEATSAESAWLELRDHVRDLRLPWSGSMTPRARERSVQQLLRDDETARGPLRRLVLAVEQARYAATVPPGAAPADDAHQVMAAISRGADRGQRVRAFLWPVSLLPDLRAGWEQVRSTVSLRSQ